MRGGTIALVFRFRNCKVQFLILSGLNTYILTRLVEEHVPFNALRDDCRVAGIESGKYLDDALEKFIRDLMEKQLILGFLKNNLKKNPYIIIVH